MSLTIDDIIRAGACRDGVLEWHERHSPNATALSLAELLADDEARDYALLAVGRNGCGDGGDGGGDGYGNGDGNGNGDGYGDGDGYGNGDGDGYGGDP